MSSQQPKVDDGMNDTAMRVLAIEHREEYRACLKPKKQKKGARA